MQKLPIHDVLDELKQTLLVDSRVVLQAPPGAGKTTIVPLELLNQPWLNNKKILMLEPRRLAARTAAARMAMMLKEKIGQTVGYQIRQEQCFADATKILVVTEGILTRKLQVDPELKDIALVIFDEFHERSLHADLSLALCLQSQQVLREDLKLLVMSATLNTQTIAGLLDNAPIIQSEGKSYPVDVHYLDKSIKQIATTHQARQLLLKVLVDTVQKFIEEQTGNCLVFLPGIKEIAQAEQQLKKQLLDNTLGHVRICPLHSGLTKQQQDDAIAISPPGQRKVVLATNIAETSITIEGITAVIDSGLERISVYNPATAMNGLETRFISSDSATQRCGRAGRLGPGVCYRLWTNQEQLHLAKHSIAEILHSDLSSLALELANWGVQEPDELHWLDQPPQSTMNQVRELLVNLQALDRHGKITLHGRDMLEMGTHPRLAHMMLCAAPHQQLYHACLIAAILSEKDLFLPRAEKSMELHTRLEVLVQYRSADNQQGWQQQGVDTQQCRRILQTAEDFFTRAERLINTGTKETPNYEMTGVLLTYAYPDRIARRRSSYEARYLLSNGKGAFIPPHLEHHPFDYLVIASLDVGKNRNRQNEATIYRAAEITIEQLEEYFAELIDNEKTIEWDEEAQRVVSRQTKLLGNIVINQELIQPENDTDIQRCLLAAIAARGLDSLNWSQKVVNLRQRIVFVHEQMNKDPTLNSLLSGEPLPDFSDEALIKSLDVWMKPYMTNEKSLKDCTRLDLYSMLLGQLSWEQQQWLDEYVPEKIQVPGGSLIRVDYSEPAVPVLAVRLQEVFGLHETPTLLKGHCKLMMHLLSPAHRPMQVTQDMSSFWKTTYHEVKKELRGKYKRHYWPDDPFTARATSKTKKNM